MDPLQAALAGESRGGSQYPGSPYYSAGRGWLPGPGANYEGPSWAYPGTAKGGNYQGQGQARGTAPSFMPYYGDAVGSPSGGLTAGYAKPNPIMAALLGGQ